MSPSLIDLMLSPPMMLALAGMALSLFAILSKRRRP